MRKIKIQTLIENESPSLKPYDSSLPGLGIEFSTDIVIRIYESDKIWIRNFDNLNEAFSILLGMSDFQIKEFIERNANLQSNH